MLILRKLVNHTNIGRVIGRILDMLYAPFVSMRDSFESATLFFHTSMVVHPRLNDHPVETQVEMIIGIHFVEMRVEMVIELYTLEL